MKYASASLALLAALVCAAPAYAETAEAAPAVEAAPAATHGDAKDVVRQFYAQLTHTMQLGDTLGFSGRYKKLEPALTQAFNLPLMTKVAVGPTWDKATPEQQRQIVKAFSAFSVATYAHQFARDDGEQFSVTGQKSASGGVIVESMLTPKTGSPVALNYLMRKDDSGNWRIVDVFLDGSISEIAMRRAEFAAVIQRDGLAGLATSLDQKSKKMGPT